MWYRNDTNTCNSSFSDNNFMDENSKNDNYMEDNKICHGVFIADSSRDGKREGKEMFIKCLIMIAVKWDTVDKNRRQ